MDGWSGFREKRWNSGSRYTLSYSLHLTNFSIFTSGSSIYHFHFFLPGIFNTGKPLLRLPESRRGKVSMWPQRPLLAGQSRCRPNCFRLSTSAVRAFPPPPILSPFLYCHTNSYFPLPQTWTFIWVLLTLSLSHTLTHTHTHTHTLKWWLQSNLLVSILWALLSIWIKMKSNWLNLMLSQVKVYKYVCEKICVHACVQMYVTP